MSMTSQLKRGKAATANDEVLALLVSTNSSESPSRGLFDTVKDGYLLVGICSDGLGRLEANVADRRARARRRVDGLCSGEVRLLISLVFTVLLNTTEEVDDASDQRVDG